MKMNKTGVTNFVWVVAVVAILGVSLATWNFYINENIQLGPSSCTKSLDLTAKEINICGTYCNSKLAQSEKTCLSKYVGSKACCSWMGNAICSKNYDVTMDETVNDNFAITYNVGSAAQKTASFKLRDIRSDGAVIIRDVNQGSDFPLSRVGDTKDWAELLLTLKASDNVKGSATINVRFGSPMSAADCSASQIIITQTAVTPSTTETYSKVEIDAKLKSAFASCSPSRGFSSSETGTQVCTREGKTCLFGTNFARIMNSTSGTVSPLHFKTLDCSENQDLYLDPLPSDMKMDEDPSWICCKV